MKFNRVLPLALSLSALLGACARDSAQAPVISDVTPQTAPTAPYTEFNTSNTIRDVMNTLIDPSADAIWNSVRFVMDDTGGHEIKPETDEDWAMQRRNAIALVEGANALMIPGRHVAPAGATTEFPEYEFVPEEVDAKLRADWQSWLAYAQGLQASALAVKDAIDARDVERLSENGGALDQACENCHTQYWYRVPNP